MESYVSAVSDTLILHKQPARSLAPQLLEYLRSTAAKADISLVS